ncbi:gpW family head-tail joining protein [Marinobacter sp. M1N3S26]|uniref:gpW family head-tail joining protein n=1 Tax=Marinobacter sp. M1N3S26 TaxID=3382299 RepID=UPI00387B2678
MSIQQQLADAKAAYHKLMTGQSVVRIERDGKTVEFRSANRSELRAYITELEAQLNPGVVRRRPAKVSY